VITQQPKELESSTFLQSHFLVKPIHIKFQTCMKTLVIIKQFFSKAMDGLAYEIIAMQIDCISPPCSFGIKLKRGM